MESVKLVVGRLLNELPYYKTYVGALDAGLIIDGEVGPVKISSPLEILYCHGNGKARNIAEKLAEECRGNASTRPIDLSDTDLRCDGKKAVVLFYLNEDTFENEDYEECEIVKRAMDDGIQVVLVHEKDPRYGGCPFSDIILQTPQELKEDPYNLYTQDIAVSLYPEEEYQLVSLRQILSKICATPIVT